MGNHAALIRAEHTGKPVVRRGKNFIEFDNGDGSKRWVGTIEPLHYGASKDQEIETGWQADTGAWQWKIEQNDHVIHARSVFNAGNLAEWRIGSSWCILDPQSINWINQDNSRQQIAIKQAVSGQASDNVMSFPAGYGVGKHFEYIAHPKRLIKHITIDNLSDLPTPTVTGTINFEAEFSLSTSANVDFWLDGVKWAKTNGVRVRTASRIECRDNTNGDALLWYLDTPTATDSNIDGLNNIVGQYEVRRQGGPSSLFITVRIPYTWIQTATFPIKIDPTYTDGYGGDIQTYKDCYLSSSAATTNYGTHIWLPTNSNSRHSVLEFDLSSIAATATCDNALLTLTHDLDYGSTDLTVYVYELLTANGNWTEAGATWNTKDGSNAWAGGATGCGTSGTDYDSTAIGSYNVTTDTQGTTNVFDLTDAAVKDWFGASNTNYGIVLISNNTDLKVYASSDNTSTAYRPKLVVDYTAAATGPTAAENNQAQVSDVATLTASGPTYNVTTADDNQAQVSDLVSLSLATTALTAAEDNQAQASDAASLTAEAPTYQLTAADDNQAQVSDVATLGVYTPIAAAENNQAQASDAASITFSGIELVNITVSQSWQAQTSDAAVLGGYTPITPVQANQTQASDAASITAEGPTFTISVSDAYQAQVSDAALVYSITPITPAGAWQAQVSDLASVTMGGLITHGTRRLYPVNTRTTGQLATRVTHTVNTRKDYEVDD